MPAHHGAVVTLNEVARRLGISRQRAQQIERSALRKLRRSKRMREIFAEMVENESSAQRFEILKIRKGEAR